MSVRALAAWVALVLGATACGPRRPPPPPTEVEDPALLVSSDELGRDFMVQQKVHATFGDRELVFQAVLQKSGGRLTIVALSLQGTRLFTLEQTGKTVRFERYTARELPFSPWHILVDIHRSYFRRGPAPPLTGRRTVRFGQEVMRETWRDGTLTERTFERPAARASGRITIRYGAGGGELLERPMRYHDGALGYTLVVTPIRFQRLP
jgi:hypothetical protein